ncbi:hypothetical protein [Lishizhenia sp.]|uniref:hypothetical protein n=1 Tax=Lishizhenia sp. TaxID=2497594 RepID=UPI00299E3068|nr:hypothetical protein [Lishizhenia sp.]MDX1446913.1 hypothetical protein [Lishizhenia sp.]
MLKTLLILFLLTSQFSAAQNGYDNWKYAYLEIDFKYAEIFTDSTLIQVLMVNNKTQDSTAFEFSGDSLSSVRSPLVLGGKYTLVIFENYTKVFREEDLTIPPDRITFIDYVKQPSVPSPPKKKKSIRVIPRYEDE